MIPLGAILTPTPTELKVAKTLRLLEGIGGGDPGRLALTVDPTNGNDSNEGSREYPLKTVQEAIDQIETENGFGHIFMMAGSTVENLVIAKSNIIIEGVMRSGTEKSEIKPTSGVPVTLGAGHCALRNLRIEATDDNGIEATGEQFAFDNLEVEVNSASAYGIWLDDADDVSITRCLLEGNNLANVIGILVGDGATRTWIGGCTIQNWGSGVTHGGANNGYGIGLHGNSQLARVCPGVLMAGGEGIEVGPNHITEGRVGIYAYASGGNVLLHSAFGNVFSMNSSYDGYDNNDHDTGANNWRGNFYAYTTAGRPWYRDGDYDGQAEHVVSWGSMYDPAPLSSPESWRMFSDERLI